MDRLAYHRARIDCYEKICPRIPLPNVARFLKFKARAGKGSSVTSCIKQVLMRKKLDDIHVVRDFPEVFPDILFRFYLMCERLNIASILIPGASPVVDRPYRLGALSEMLEFVRTILKTSNMVDPLDLFQVTLNQTQKDINPKLTNHHEGSKILHSIERTLLEEEIFAEFDEFMAMTVDENSDSESDTKDAPFEKITINTNYKIKTTFKEPPTDLELKPLPDNPEYVFLEEPSFLPVIISSQLSKEKKSKLISVLKNHKQAFAWKTTDIPGICPSFCKHKIQLLDDKKPVVQKQRSPIHCVPKKGGITVVTNENDELVPTRTITGWRVCIDYRKLNEATAKDHFPLPFMDQMLERIARNKYFCFLNGFSGYFQIPIDPNDHEKTTFTCPFGTYAYRRMPFDLSNAPATFQRCMLAIFHDMIEESVKIFMDDFSVFGNSFITCLNNLDKMLQRCKDAHLVLNWEKYHFMVKEGIVLGHKVSSAGLEVDKAKIDVISKLPPPTNIKSIRNFLRHAGFYRRFIKDFSKIARPLTKHLEKDTPFEFNEECRRAFESLQEKLTCAPLIVSPN
ncbi:reverse transcriptase domain-containing protein [Tanacetum coccineum]